VPALTGAYPVAEFTWCLFLEDSLTLAHARLLTKLIRIIPVRINQVLDELIGTKIIKIFLDIWE
jgi:uncharacterized protein YbcI